MGEIFAKRIPNSGLQSQHNEPFRKGKFNKYLAIVR
jgi:hypothetical protein